ncbi:ankyrin repeat-containing domain protein [Morchella snyderi]|nr:ankyrin repeat-containing domain protein [Morchella snyderi]
MHPGGLKPHGYGEAELGGGSYIPNCCYWHFVLSPAHCYESILGGLSWALARKEVWPNAMDPPKSEKPCDVEGLKRSKEYCWLFHNPDYEEWSKEDNGFKTLVVGGHNNLSPLTSYHQVMPKVQGPCLSLCFSSMPTRITKDAQVVWELFRQAMDACSQEQQGLIFTQFLKRLIECNPNHEQAGLASSPNVRLQEILDASQSSELWSALGSAIGTIARYPDKAIANSPGGRFKSLTIILYLNEAERNVYRPVLESIQILRGYVELSGSFDRVRVLILDGFLNGENEHYDSEYFISHRIYVMGRQGCLRSLAFQNTRYEKISPHQEHTFDWLCHTNEYMSWNTRYDPCLLLIEGKPGSGKSTLMRYIKENVNPAGKDTIISSFFYSARDGTAESSHLNMLKALLHSILEADETFFLHFQQTYVKQRRGDISRGWEVEELKQIMVDACTNHPFPSTIYWVIDALDESDNTNSSRIEIVQHFEKVLDAARNNKRLLVKIVLGSRPLNELQDMCRISLQEKTKGDIQKYTTARLNDKVFTKCDMSLRKEFEDYIVTTADGVFLWVRLVIDELGKQVRNGSSINNLLGLLKSLPKDLESFYEHIFKELKKCRDANELIAGGRILGLCLLSHRAIELGELRDALALFDNQTQSEPEPTRWEQNRSVNIRNLVICCAGGLVDIKDRENGFSVAQLMHQTVREFLKSPPEIMIGTPFNITDYVEVSLRISLMCVEFLEIMCVELKPGGKGYPICTEYLNNRPLLKYSVEYLLENRDSIDARAEARLKKLIERLNVDLGSNGDLGSSARILLWKLIEPTISDDIKLGTLLLDAARNGHAIAISNLLAVGADIEFSAPVNQDRALHFAARGGHESAAILLLDGDANIDSGNILDVSPLYMAAAAGQMALFDLLLSYGADPSPRGNFEWTPLEFAAANGRFNITQRLFQDDLATLSEIVGKDMIGWALEFALLGGYDDIATKLLQPNLRFWEKDTDGLDIFSFAAIGGNEITIKKLLDLAGPPEDKNQNYDEYINLGGLYGNSSSVEFFTKLAGAKSEDKSYLTGESLYTGGPENDDIANFYTAAAHDHSVVIEWLILRGLDITTCSYCDNRYPALHHLILSGAYESCNALIVCSDYADITDRDWSGSTPLHLAVGKNFNDRLAGALMKGRPDTEAVDNNGETPLHHAARGGSVDACLFLLGHRASLEATDKNGSTPLHMAAMSGHLDVCKKIVHGGANRSAVDLNGLTPSGVALQAGFENIASFLSRPDEDITSDEDSTSVTDSDGSDPPCPGSATWLEEYLTSSPGPVHLASPGSSSNISSAPLEEVYGTRSSNEHHSSTHVCSKVTSMMELDEVREDELPPASRRRPRSSSDIVKDSTERVKPKRRRNADEGI